MNKQDRYSFIANAAKKNLVARPLPPSLHDIREEVALAKAHDDDNSILDAEELPSGVSAEMVRATEKAKRGKERDDSVLTPQERREIPNYRGFVVKAPVAAKEDNG